MRAVCNKQILILALTNIISFYFGLNISKNSFEDAKEEFLKKYFEEKNYAAENKILEEITEKAPIKIAEPIFRRPDKLKKEKSFTKKLQSLLPSSPKSYTRSSEAAICYCEEERRHRVFYYTSANVPNKNALEKLRDEDFRKYKAANYYQFYDTPLLLSQAQSAIQYVSSGYEIEPFESFVPYIRIVSDDPEEKFKFKISSKYGSIVSDKNPHNEANSTALEYWTELENVNRIIQGLRYIPKFYDARPFTDLISFTLTSTKRIEEVKIPVKIRRKPLPILQFIKSNELHEMVTIVTKTIFRYNCLRSLLLSIMEYYPKVTIIVADDNPAEVYQILDPVKFPTVKQYRMPAEEGWFAGRALAISQVRTPYFVWVDDDTAFVKETNIAEMMQIAEKTGYDIIGGGLGSKARREWQHFDRFDIPYSEKGYCYNRVRPKYDIPLTGYEGKCFVVDVTANFYLARTATAGAIRMDPQFEQKAHREFFIDSVGKLRIAYCNMFVVGHRQEHYPSKCIDNDKTEYNDRRFPTGEDKTVLERRINELWFYRNNLKCYKDFLF